MLRTPLCVLLPACISAQLLSQPSLPQLQVAGNLRIAKDTRRKQGLSALLEASRGGFCSCSARRLHGVMALRCCMHAKVRPACRSSLLRRCC